MFFFDENFCGDSLEPRQASSKMQDGATHMNKYKKKYLKGKNLSRQSIVHTILQKSQY